MRPLLLLLHPAATLASVWRPMQRMWEAEHRMIAPDLVPTDDPARQLQDWAASAAAAIHTADAGPAYVIGASLGASVALRLALDYPTLVAGLTLDSAQLGGQPPPAALRAMGRGMARVARLMPTAMLAHMLVRSFPAYQGADRAALHADIMRLGVTGIAAQLRAQLTHDVRAESHRITMPTLLLAGSRDLLTRSGAHTLLHAALPHARLQIIPGAGHVIFRSHPEVLQHAVP